jgi:hypothetical protein
VTKKGTSPELHGLSRSAEYRIWTGMKQRCTVPKYKHRNYQGRGIVVCERWQSFANFLCDMGKRPSPKHSIDRIDSNKGYEPGNVRWATRIEQNRNMRTVRHLTHKGITLSVPEWAERLGISVATLRVRLHRGRNVERALEPVKR